jgi:DNA-binding MarR family transcriptional regulator
MYAPHEAAKLANMKYKEICVDASRYNDYRADVARTIQAEIKQTKPFGTPEEEAAVSLARTASLLEWRGTEMLKPYGIPPTQYNALRILRGAGKLGLACSEIGERMINRDPDVTRLLDRLERRGLVERSRERKDRRVITARITSAGLELLSTLDGPVEEFHKKVLGHMRGHGLETLIKLLAVAREKLG